MEYHEEPRLVFSPLTEKDYCEFYDLEMENYVDDIDFYLTFIEKNHTVLELGCGSGRLTSRIAAQCKSITGVDLSGEMIRRAQKNTSILSARDKKKISYRQTDMLEISFNNLFDVILIPYNTLNLLGEQAKISKCLQLCKEHLHDDGMLLVHIYHPTAVMLKPPGEKSFQFVIFEKEDGEKIVKETLKSYCEKSHSLSLEERYRIRPIVADVEKRDLRHTMKLYCPDYSLWLKLFSLTGFEVKGCWKDHHFTQFTQENSSSLFIHAARNHNS